MKTIVTCVYQTANQCRLFRKRCNRDYSPDHFPNNMNCEHYKPKTIYEIEVKSREVVRT